VFGANNWRLHLGTLHTRLLLESRHALPTGGNTACDSGAAGEAASNVAVSEPAPIVSSTAELARSATHLQHNAVRACQTRRRWWQRDAVYALWSRVQLQ